ncbi:hypothetical protein ['Camptotheca acuminata' phytoplasma]|uniref:hypothetical protein n=1 Tax='Camptotheca acuminata' phytoplasma TaxID=3239192 RepID=UPI00351A4094
MSLQSDQDYHQDMLSRAKDYKKDLMGTFAILTQREKNDFIKSLNEFYDITSVEE